MAYNLLSEKELDVLEGKVRSGDIDTLEKFRRLSKRVAKAANSRLLRLEKADFTESNAYQRATYYTEYAYKAERFRVNNSMNIDDLLENYREMRTFMRKESSTVRGMKYIQKRLMTTLESYNIHIDEDYQTIFFKFINSDTVLDALDVIGESDIVFDAIASNLRENVNNLEKLRKEFDAFLRGEVFYDELLERIGGLTFEELHERSRKRGIDIYSRTRRRM